MLQKLHWLPLYHRIIFKVLSITFKMICGCAPPYLKDLLEPYVPGRSLRSAYTRPIKARLYYTRFLVRHGYKWYGCQKVEFGSFIYTSIFSRAKQFYFCVWYANQTQMFVQDSVSRITSTQYACVLCCFKMADGEFLEDFLFNFFKRRRLAYRKLEQFLNVSIGLLSLLSGCSHYQYYYNLH